MTTIKYLFFLLLAMSEPMVYAKNHIVLWQYDESLSYERLVNYSDYNEAKKTLKPAIEISLDDLSQYLWDEQIFSMPHNIYSEKYEDKLTPLNNGYYENSRKSSLFFSIVVEDRIILSGLNRTMPAAAELRPYDDSNYPRLRLIISPVDDFVYFQLTYEQNLTQSIWDISPRKRGDLESLFITEIHSYFELKQKIIRGRFDILKLFYTGNLIKIY